ncbi:ankyrin repeat-containing domain protein [Cercophora scortea]|uniref:Ankyrin repeat-containing domain protein n=1 Tax=Cercophora scortea TaxID=314031 RepID=A0AAE0M6L5_9PEZI|nr:ankyrin repeat-containing domain protein [Cercophora scortea]
MPPPKAGPTDTEWNRYKALIRRRYLVDELSLKELCQDLVQEGLTVTLKQLEHQLRDWRFLRNIPASSWQYAGHRIEKRKLAGKDSLVVFNGKRVKPSTVKKETNRNRVVTYAAASAPSPSTPPNLALSVCTPPSLPLDFEWQSNLPWLSFQRNYPQLLSAVMDSQMHTHPSSNSGDTLTLQALHLTADNLILRQDLLHGDANVVQIATGIAREMPESFSGEHLASAEILARGSSADVAAYYQECTKLLFFRMSNCLDDTEPNYTTLRTIMKLLSDSGILHAPLYLASRDDPTIASFLERLFGQLLNSWELDRSEAEDGHYDKALDIVKWILSSGFDPNTPITDRIALWWSGYSSCLTPLQYALCHDAFGVALSLINAGADLNRTSEGCKSTPLQLFIQHFPEDFSAPDGLSKVDLVEQLIKSGAQVNITVGRLGFDPSPLESALLAGDIALVDLLVRNGADIECRTPFRPFPFLEGGTILSQCAGNCIDESTAIRLVDYMLGAFKSQFPDRPIDSVITTEVMMAAAARGYANVIQLLRSKAKHLDFSSNRAHASALHVAALYDHLELCTLLLQWGHSVDGDGADGLDDPVRNEYPTPLHIACLGENPDLVQLFVSHGADITKIWILDSESIAPHTALSPPSRLAPSENLVRSLSSPGSPYKTLFGEITSLYKTVTPIQLALAAGCHQNEGSLPCATILSNAGAALPRDSLYYTIGGHDRLFYTLLDMGFDPNVRRGDRAGTKAGAVSLLAFALRHEGIKREQREEYASVLLARGAKPTSSDFLDAVDLGACWGLIKQMMDCGAPLDGQGKPSGVALEVALLHGHQEIIKHLFDEFPALEYDPCALCAAVRTALIAPSSSRIWVEHLLRKRVEGPSTDKQVRVEGAAFALAVRHKDWAMIDLLTRFIPVIPSTAILPLSVAEWDFHPPRELGALGWIDQSPGGWSTERSQFWMLRRKGFPREGCYIGSPIVPAVILGDISFVERLLGRGFCPDMLSLSMAARKNCLSMARLLVSVKVPPPLSEGFDYRQTDPMQWAIRHQNEVMFDFFINLGMDTRSQAYMTKAHGRSYLQTAVHEGALGIINRLLESGEDVNELPATSGGARSLEIAATKGFLGIAQLLINRGADVNAYGWNTALKSAAQHGRIDMIQLLINHGAKASRRAILAAEEQGHFAAARMLERHWELSDKDNRVW